MKEQIKSKLWQERFRPEKVKSIIMPLKTKRYILKAIKEKEIPNMIFYSNSPGTGKTSTAKAICKELDCNYLFINVSKDSGIDTLRNKIENYASTVSFKDGKKVIILDEFEGGSVNLQNGLKSFLETFHNNCRFIFTCNNINKVIEPLKSRCQLFDFNYTDQKTKNSLIPQCEKLISAILSKMKIEYDEDTLKQFIEAIFPDIRSMLGILHKYSEENGSIDSGILNQRNLEIDPIFFEYIKQKNLVKVRKHMIDYNVDYDRIFTILFNSFVPMLESSQKAEIILLLADYQYKHSFVIDKEINFSACILEIMKVL